MTKNIQGCSTYLNDWIYIWQASVFGIGAKIWFDLGQKSIIVVSRCKLISFISNFEPQTHLISTADPTILAIGVFLQCSWWTNVVKTCPMIL